ncbi:hypothetical protein RHMOL_Rhmol01G0307300 [Rhododendron molle]|uniref:Uncharacterized protein n=1 Tax=Rhododendron molle TaxID=49168 RepID=A0ACC0QAT6_RHOML|nr:hypothetical protein RHMOL_Rhmol01G0307300 [Rhododendron molle]
MLYGSPQLFLGFLVQTAYMPFLYVHVMSAITSVNLTTFKLDPSTMRLNLDDEPSFVVCIADSSSKLSGIAKSSSRRLDQLSDVLGGMRIEKRGIGGLYKGAKSRAGGGSAEKPWAT